jgi:hypothetical protein
MSLTIKKGLDINMVKMKKKNEKYVLIRKYKEII